jgi:diacylglycerol kinase family enzyme
MTPDLRRRGAAVVALAVGLAAVVVTALSLWGQVARAVLAVGLVLLAVACAWSAATRRGGYRLLASAVVVAVVAALALVVLGSDASGLMLVVVMALLAATAVLARYALRPALSTAARVAVPGRPVGPATHGALIMNLRSGGGKAERFHLEQEATQRGVEAIVLRPGDDLLELAQGALDRGADVLGMAGGDGSQALVASVAMRADVPLVCIPAGTRNHFALDLGLDRDDVVGALDAFDDAVERRIDLATVNDRVFVNNVSLGVYAEIVQSPEYRDAKRQTTVELLPELLGPEAEPSGLRFTGPDGTERAGAQIIQVSNNPYVLTRIGGFGSRARLDTGELGIAAAEVRGSADVTRIVAAQAAGRLRRFPGWHEWSAPRFVVDADAPVAAGVDGEALVMDPPLVFASLPSALRVRVPVHAPGSSPAAKVAPSAWWSISALLRLAVGRPGVVDEPRADP